MAAGGLQRPVDLLCRLLGPQADAHPVAIVAVATAGLPVLPVLGPPDRAAASRVPVLARQVAPLALDGLVADCSRAPAAAAVAAAPVPLTMADVAMACGATAMAAVAMAVPAVVVPARTGHGPRAGGELRGARGRPGCQEHCDLCG